MIHYYHNTILLHSIIIFTIMGSLFRVHMIHILHLIHDIAIITDSTYCNMNGTRILPM